MRNQTTTTSNAPLGPAPLLTKEQVARNCQVSLRTVENWTKRRVIPAIKVRRTVRYRWAAVEEGLRKWERKSL